MGLDYLLCRCLVIDKSSYVDQGTGRGVKIDRRPGELILVCAPDKESIREETRRYFGVQRFCDVIIFYASAALKCPTIVLVELKGKDIIHAIAQLEAVITGILKKNPFLERHARFKALIVTTGSVPSQVLKTTQEHFMKTYKMTLYQKTHKHGNVHIREVVN
jgi:hypothetical protein